MKAGRRNLNWKTKSIGAGSITIIAIVICLNAVSSDHRSPIYKSQPNIIFIMSDDHGYQAIGAYNDRFKNIISTPQIDRLAKEGMRFNRCLVTNSLCGPARAVILTGKYSHMNGFLGNSGEKFDGGQQTFPKLLQQAGYQTAIIGKWHLGSSPTGFNHWEILNDQGQYYNPEFINGHGTHQEKGYVTDLITEKALAWLKEEKETGKPFMLMVHHKAPHREWEPALKYLPYYKGILFPVPSTLFDNYTGRGTAAREQKMSVAKDMLMDADLKMWNDKINQNYIRTRGRMDSVQGAAWDHFYDSIHAELDRLNPQGQELVRWKYQRYIYDYMSCIKSVDESVGRILDWLRESGLDKNTIVIYTSDQGFYLGEHGWFDKRFMYEQSYRTPLLIKWPGVIKPGTINRDMVSNLDFAETFLAIAGIPVPADMQGKSLVPLFQDQKPADWRKEHYYHYYEYPAVHSVKRHYGISTDRYILIHYYYDIDEWELYDLQKDPEELKNVYNDAAYAEIRNDLKSRLKVLREYYKENDKYENELYPRKAVQNKQ
jgi:arylsulfatase A-like enzyme